LNNTKTLLPKKKIKNLYNRYLQYSPLLNKSLILVGKSYNSYNTIFTQNSSKLSSLKVKQDNLFLKSNKNPFLLKIKERLSTTSLKTLNNNILFTLKSSNSPDEVNFQTNNSLYSKPYLFSNLTNQTQSLITDFNSHLIFSTYLVYQEEFNSDSTFFNSQFSRFDNRQSLLTNCKTTIKINNSLSGTFFGLSLNTKIKLSKKKKNPTC
jgi:hypothetical protein